MIELHVNNKLAEARSGGIGSRGNSIAYKHIQQYLNHECYGILKKIETDWLL